MTNIEQKLDLIMKYLVLKEEIQQDITHFRALANSKIKTNAYRKINEKLSDSFDELDEVLKKMKEK